MFGCAEDGILQALMTVLPYLIASSPQNSTPNSWHHDSFLGILNAADEENHELSSFLTIMSLAFVRNDDGNVKSATEEFSMSIMHNENKLKRPLLTSQSNQSAVNILATMAAVVVVMFKFDNGKQIVEKNAAHLSSIMISESVLKNQEIFEYKAWGSMQMADLLSTILNAALSLKSPHETPKEILDFLSVVISKWIKGLPQNEINNCFRAELKNCMEKFVTSMVLSRQERDLLGSLQSHLHDVTAVKAVIRAIEVIFKSATSAKSILNMLQTINKSNLSRISIFFVKIISGALLGNKVKASFSDKHKMQSELLCQMVCNPGKALALLKGAIQTKPR